GMAFSAASRSQTPRARTMSPSISSGPSPSELPRSSASASGNDSTLVGLSLPRHSAFNARNCSSPVSRTESSTGRAPAASCGNALSATADSAARRTSSVQSMLLSHSASASMSISSIIRASGPWAFISLDDASDQRMAHHVGGGEADDLDTLDAFKLADPVIEAGSHTVRKVGLMRVAANDHAAAHAEAREEHLHLLRRGVLRLIEDDEGVVQSAAAHEADRRNLDLARRDAALDLLGREHVVEGVVKRAEIGIDLLLHVAGKEPQALDGFARGARQDQPVDAAADQLRDGLGDGEIGLAGAGGAEREDHLVARHRF